MSKHWHLHLGKNKTKSTVLKVNFKNNPSCLILYEKDSETGMEIWEDISYSINSNNNSCGQGFIFLKEFLNYELVSKTEMEYLLQFELDKNETRKMNTDINGNDLKELDIISTNYIDNFSVYDINQENSYYENVENFIKLLE